VILEVPGHWIAAVGLDEDGTILINDPYYRDRKTLDVYAGKVRSSVHYEPSSDLSSVVITAPADVKFKITDKQGRVVNTGTGTIDQPTDTLSQIGGSVSARHAWRTHLYQRAAIRRGHEPGSCRGRAMIMSLKYSMPGPMAASDPRTAATALRLRRSRRGGTKADRLRPNADKPVINISTNGTPQPATSTPRPSDGGAGGEDETPTPLPSPTGVPTPTSTPFVEQRTAMTLPAEPGQTRVEVATNSGELGDPIRFAPLLDRRGQRHRGLRVVHFGDAAEVRAQPRRAHRAVAAAAGPGPDSTRDYPPPSTARSASQRDDGLQHDLSAIAEAGDADLRPAGERRLHDDALDAERQGCRRVLGFAFADHDVPG
jgi:hypothetical protein